MRSGKTFILTALGSRWSVLPAFPLSSAQLFQSFVVRSAPQPCFYGSFFSPYLSFNTFVFLPSFLPNAHDASIRKNFTAIVRPRPLGSSSYRKRIKACSLRYRIEQSNYRLWNGVSSLLHFLSSIDRPWWSAATPLRTSALLWSGDEWGQKFSVVSPHPLSTSPTDDLGFLGLCAG